MDGFKIIMQSTGSFLTLLIMTRLMGKKQMSQLSFFHYVTGITIGNIAADISDKIDSPFWHGWISLMWWAILTILMGLITLRWPKARVLIDGQPTIVIKKGLLEEKALRKLRLHVDDLSMMLRKQSIFSIREVDYAIFEKYGKLSVLKTQEQIAPTRKDFNLSVQEAQYLPTEIIIDGRIIHHSLAECGLNKSWLEKQLNGINEERVLYAELQMDGTLYYQLKEYS